MSAFEFSGTRDRSWLHRPIHDNRVRFRSSHARVALELALAVLALTALAFTVS